MDEKGLEQLRNSLEKLNKIEQSILRDKGFTEEVLNLKMLIALIKEQVPNEDTYLTAR